MAKYKKIESEWFKRELEPHEEHLRTWLSNKYPNLADIDDVIQEAYISTLNRQREQKLEYPKAFLYSVSRNVAVDLIRRSKVIKFEQLGAEGISDALPKENHYADERLLQSEKSNIMYEAINKLPKRCRSIMILRKINGLPLAEIAKKLGISINTVEFQITLGMRKLRKHLRQFEGEF